MSSPQGQPPRVALIGVSGYGTIYLQLLRDALRRKTVALKAAVIINQLEVPEIVAELKAAGATIYADADTFFARETGSIDLCLIPVGIQWHARLTIAALHAGMNVLVEKPLAGSLADIADIRRAEAESGRWVAVGFQDLYSLESRWLKTQLLAGVIGKIDSIRMIGLWPRPRTYFTRNHWAGRLRADGAAVLDSPLNNAFAHFVNLALYLAGPSEPESASVRVDSAELLRAHHIEMFDTAVVLGSSPAGVHFWFGASHAINILREPEIHLHGDAGSAVWRHESRCDLTFADGRSRSIPLPDAFVCRRAMFDAALARLRDPAARVCTTAVAARHAEFVSAVQDAASVQTVPESLVDCTPTPAGDSEIPCVQGLDETLARAFASGSPLVAVSSLTAHPPLAHA